MIKERNYPLFFMFYYKKLMININFLLTYLI